MFITEVAWAQIIGARESQQDSVNVVSWPNGFRLLMLGDGMGGHAAGDIASGTVLKEFREHFINSTDCDMRTRMLLALDAANKKLFQLARENLSLSGMGTTLLAVIFDGNSIQWLSIGDSPMWLLRNGELRRLNENHSMSTLLSEKVAAGELSREAAAQSPMRTQLLEAVMGEDIEMVDAPRSVFPLQEGDWLLLASDGVETCAGLQIVALLQRDNICAADFVIDLLEAVKAVNKPGQDNASIVVLRVLAKAGDEPDTVLPAEKLSIAEPHTLLS